MEKKLFWLTAIGCSLILLITTFIFWPLMGHDYALIFPGLVDLKLAWTGSGILNPHFSPMKCLGSPMWSNPVSFNLSILHFLTLISNDLIAVILFLLMVSLTSFWGAYRLSIRMQVPQSYALYLACGWTLQGWMILRSSVGHVTYITVGWFPLIIYLLLKQRTLTRDILSGLLCGFLVSQYLYLAAPYTPFFLLVSSVILLPLIFYWRKQELIEWKHLLIKVTFSGLFSLILIYPKLSAVNELLSAYPRINSLQKVGWSALPYSILNLFSFLPHDFKRITGWWYGNWESIQFIFPLLLISILVVWIKEKQQKLLVQTVLSLTYLLIISFLMTSGAFADLFRSLPFFNSMHVNPRWNIILALPVLFICAAAEPIWSSFPRVWKLALFVLVLFVPFIHLNKEVLNINYTHLVGYQEKVNRLEYCYEPFLGYSLEYFPLRPESGAINFAQEPLIDPRCYLPKNGCSPGSPLTSEDLKLLESYKLR